MSTSYKQKVVEYAKASYSGLAVVTSEVSRAEIETLKAAQILKRGFRVWTVTKGWREADSDSNGRVVMKAAGGGESGPSDPAEGVAGIGEGPNSTIYVMHVFEEMFKQPAVRQLFRDVLGPAREQRKVIVLLGSFTVPPDLDKEFAGIEFDLPDRDALTAIASDLVESLDLELPAPEELAKVVDGALGLTELEASNAYALSLVRNKQLDTQSIIDTKKEIVRRSGILTYMETQESLDTVGGLDDLKAWLMMREAGFTQEAKKFGLTPPKGILMAGVPGCGKSLVAKAISAAWGLPLLSLDMGRVFGSLVGQSERQLQDALRTAEALSPCILFIDEFEKAVAGMGGGSTDGGTTQRVMGSLLTWMQDRPVNKPVFVVATANNISALPPEMLRKGRWDEIFAVLLPNKDEREQIFRVHLSKVGRDPEAFKLEGLSTLSEGFTGSEIEEAVKDALWRAFAQGKELAMGHLNEAIRATIPLSKGPMKDTIDLLVKDNRFRKATSVAVESATKTGRNIET